MTRTLHLGGEKMQKISGLNKSKLQGKTYCTCIMYLIPIAYKIF